MTLHLYTLTGNSVRNMCTDENKAISMDFIKKSSQCMKTRVWNRDALQQKKSMKLE